MDAGLLSPPPPPIIALNLPENHRFSPNNRGQAVFLISSVVKVCAVLTALIIGSAIALIALSLTGCDNDGNNTTGNGETQTHAHTYAATWSSNATQHWHECTAGDGAKTDVANHTPGDWKIDAPATETVAGSRHKECTVCEYVTATETIPATGTGHTHTWGAWQKNAAQHWRECTANDGAKTDEGNHTGSPCTACGYASGGLTVEDVEFKGIEDVWNSGNVSGEINFVLGQLANQSGSIAGRFDYGQNASIDDVVNIQYQISSAYGNGTNILFIKTGVATYINDLSATIGSLSNNPGAFTQKVNAFLTAHALGQREAYGYNGHPNDKKEKEDALIAQVNALGMPATTVAEAITALESSLRASMPEEFAQYGADLIQSWEDFGQFDGWTTDLQQTGASMNITRP